MADKNIVLGVTGGIAAYKAAELTRLLRNAGASVRVVMTQAATSFVAPLTFQALSGYAVHLDLLDAAEEAAMGHINLARWADLVLVAPATADFIARLRVGRADDLLAALCLATEAEIALAPAMNRAMWDNPATQENVSALAARGVRMIGPAQGAQACGETGWGRMLEPAEIRDEIVRGLHPGSLAGLSVLVSAGPTREPIDPVRFISNRSSGKMGFAVADAAARQGARVILVSGPVALPTPRAVDRVDVETADEMYRAVMARAGGLDIYIGTAAVADYTPATVEGRKIKKSSQSMALELRRTADILGAVAALERPPFTVGFAAETDRVEDYAREKLRSKRLDMIAANQVGQPLGGFDSDSNALHVFWGDGDTVLDMAPKQRIAAQLIELIAHYFHAKNTAQDPGRPARS